jgi:Tat protein translocase TatB subunit
MFNVGMPELLVILGVALIFLGPKRLPEVARTLGKALAELRKATAGINQELDNARAMLEEEARRASTPAVPPRIPPAGTEAKAPAGSTASSDDASSETPTPPTASH